MQYVPDPLVKVFDVRMQRQLSPMSMSVGSPTVLKFVPSGPQSAEDISPASILMGASTGIVQVCPLSGAMIDSQLMYAPLTSRKEVMTTMAVSPSGQVMCVGTSTGAIAQYVLKMPEGIKIKVNEVRQLDASPYPLRVLIFVLSYITSLTPSHRITS